MPGWQILVSFLGHLAFGDSPSIPHRCVCSASSLRTVNESYALLRRVILVLTLATAFFSVRGY